MGSLFDRVKAYFDGREATRASEREEVIQLEDELRALQNEVRFHTEPSFQSDLARKRGDLERETRALVYETREPERSQLQGRCQRLIEDIERPDAVQTRIREVNQRLVSLRGGSAEADDGLTVDGAADHTGEVRAA